jgi:hypothetical protein
VLRGSGSSAATLSTVAWVTSSPRWPAVLQVRHGVFNSSHGVGFLLPRAPVRRLQDGEGSARATPWAGGEASARRTPSFSAARSSSSAPWRRSSSGLARCKVVEKGRRRRARSRGAKRRGKRVWRRWLGKVERVRRLGGLYAAQQPKVRAPAADDRDGATAWRGDVGSIQQGQRIGKGSERGLGRARPHECAPARAPVEPVPSMRTRGARALYGQRWKKGAQAPLTGGPGLAASEG